ncbi:hypothetical protein GI364_24740 (plasmid) [Alicyclobacillus sp. SO9]|nr:hypothetical protein GI364_24740 [Alicyclobacillus sp. SO9]
MKYWTVRPESLVDDFLEIAFSHATKLIFPGELRETVLKHYDNPPTADALQRECAAVYVRHEMNRWRQRSDLEKWANEMGTAFVKWRTCQDERVCPVCQGYEDVLYPISKIPELPACWDCRCYYEPVVDMKYLQWPRKVYSNGKVSMMERKEFEQLF